eukprot:Skav218100  [mRNA]  locus=scaffold759:38457:39266:- [translate_table: standard]
MVSPSVESSGKFFRHVLPLELIAAIDFAEVKRLILGRRCENLKRIERTTGSQVTLRGPCPTYVAINGPTQEAVSAAVRLVHDLLASEIGWLTLSRRDAGNAVSPCPQWNGPDICSEYMSASEMEAMLRRLSYPNAAELVAEMQAEGLPFAEEQTAQHETQRPNHLEQLLVSGGNVEESVAGPGKACAPAKVCRGGSLLFCRGSGVEESTGRARTDHGLQAPPFGGQVCRTWGGSQHDDPMRMKRTPKEACSGTSGIHIPALRSPLDDLD